MFRVCVVSLGRGGGIGFLWALGLRAPVERKYRSCVCKRILEGGNDDSGQRCTIQRNFFDQAAIANQPVGYESVSTTLATTADSANCGAIKEGLSRVLTRSPARKSDFRSRQIQKAITESSGFLLANG